MVVRESQQEELAIKMVVEFRQISAQVVHGLINRPGYRFLDEKTFTAKVFNAVSQDEQCRAVMQSDGNLENLVTIVAKRIYCESLYAGCCSQHQREQERAYEELGHYLYRVAFNYMVTKDCSEDLAKECTQKALDAIYRHIHTVKNPIAFLSFAITTLNRLCGPAVEKVKRQADREDELGILNNRQASFGSITPYLLNCLLEAIARLPNKDMRLVLTLEHFAGFDDNEIALVLGEKKNNVQQLRFRARKMMQDDQTLYKCLQND